MKQRTMILRHLRRGEAITPKSALEIYGIMRLAARIQELRDDGYVITTTMREGRTRYGTVSHYAEYRLADKQPNVA